MSILEVSLYLQSIGTTLAILFNCILIFIVIKANHTAIGYYKYMIICFASFEMIYAAVVLIFMPSNFVGGRSWVLFSVAGPAYNTPFAVLSPVLYCAFYFLWMYFVMTHFLYRYIVLCRPILSERIQSRILPKLFIVFAWLLGACYLCFCAAFFCTREEVTEGVRSKIKSVFGINNDFASGYLIVRLTKLDGSYSIPGCLAAATHYLFFPGNLAVIIFCSINVFFKIREFDATRTEAGNVHKDVFLTLVVQTVIPAVLCHAPAIMYLSFPFIDEGASFGSFSLLFTVLGTIPKILDPIITLTCIRQYRSQIRSYFKKPNPIYAVTTMTPSYRTN